MGVAGRFLAELKRRKVYHVAAAYAAVGLAISVGVPDLFSAFDLPTSAARLVIIVVVLGFPVALVLAWAYEVRPEQEPQSEEAPTTPAATELLPDAAEPLDDSRPSIAVLPFASFSKGQETDYFGLGVMEDILTRLARVKGIRLVSRTSAMCYKAAEKSTREIARELGVRAVLEGSVRRSGGKVRVVAQLIDGISDEHLWAETYDRDLEDVFHVQTEVAESIAVALQAELTEEERESVRRIPTDDLGAWDLYVRGTHAFQEMGPKNFVDSLEYLREAVELDPDFAQAWAVTAEVLVLSGLSLNERPLDLFPKIRHAAERALALDPMCGEAHTAMGVLKFFHEWDPEGAEQEFTRALALDPDNAFALDWKALTLALCGRQEEARTWIRRSLAMDPLSAAGHIALGQVLTMGGPPEEAIEALETAVRVWPESPILQQWLAIAYLFSGRAEDAIQAYDRAVERSEGNLHVEALRAGALGLIGRVGEARAVLDDLKARSAREYVDPYSLFSISIAIDGFEAAAPYLEEALEVRSLYLPYLWQVPRFRPLRAHPRFRAVIDKVLPGVAAEA